MVELLALAAFVLASASALFLAVLVARRVSLAARARERDDARVRLLPLALELADGDAVETPRLSRRDQEVLADTLGELARRLRGDATERIAAYFRGSAALRHELAALSSRRGWRRATAASRLGDMAAGTAVPALRGALDDDDRDVRAAAARSLGRLGDAGSAAAIVERLADGRLPRGLAAYALTLLGEDAIPSLRELARERDPSVRAVAVRLLGLVGGHAEASLAEAALADPAAEVRAAAADALARIGSGTSARRLRAALGDRIGFVAAAAADALGELGDREAGPALAALARGAEFDTARAAARALARIDPAGLGRTAAVPGAGPHLHEAADLLAL